MFVGVFTSYIPHNDPLLLLAFIYYFVCFLSGVDQEAVVATHLAARRAGRLRLRRVRALEIGTKETIKIINE